MPLIILSGLPGSGKTTFAAALAAATPIEHVESDAIRRSMAGQPRYTKAEHRKVFAEVERRVDEGLGHGRLVVLDATNLRDEFRRRYWELAAARGDRVVFVALTAPLGTLRKRVGGPREGHSQAGVNVLDGMVRDVERFGGAVLMVDTRYDTRPSVDAALMLVGVGE
jgi:hypothetical protein